MRIKPSDLINIAEGRFWYLATPYTAPYSLSTEEAAALRDSRATAARRISGWLTDKGVFCYCAIWAHHHNAIDFNLRHDYKWWADLNDAFIKPSAGVIVGQLDGWNRSDGIEHEIKQARKWDLPVIYLLPDFYNIIMDDEEPIMKR